MSNWHDGYVTDIDYTYGYFRELAPAQLSLVLLNRAIEGNGAATPRYLELGFGQGVSLAIHAAACKGEFWGTDFHAGHAANARALVAAAGGHARIFDESFDTFAARGDLPEFDVIALHGVWSWISPEQRASIVDLARRRLAPGGIFYVSYNAMPGCAPMQPMQHLMTLHNRLASAAGVGIPKKIDDAVGLVRAVIDAGAHYFQFNPIVAARFEKLATRNRTYLAHEFLGEHWQPMAFADVQTMLEAAKLGFAGSADLSDHLDSLHLHPEGLALLADIDSPVLRETVRDMLINRQFRIDVFVRGPRAMSILQRHAAYLATRFILVTPPALVPATLKTIAGELVFEQAIHQPLLAALADNNHAVKSLATLRAWPGLQDKPLESLIQAIAVLNGEGHVLPAQSEAVIDRVRDRCTALNESLMRQACYRKRIGCLASPVTGAGIPVKRIEQLFLLAHRGSMPMAQWPGFATATMLANGGAMKINGESITDPKQVLMETTRRAEAFIADRLPILASLGIV